MTTNLEQKITNAEESLLLETHHSNKSVLKEVTSKLITHEDPIHFHKTFGLLSLVSFIYRYGYMYYTRGDLGFSGSTLDVVTMLVHMMLSTSSLIFHVLKARLYNRPMMIWEEYRLHAIVFTTRCMSVFAYGLFRPLAPSKGFSEDLEYVALFVLVMVHHVVADLITQKYGSKAGHTTVRIDDSKDSVITTLFLRFYAFYQVTAVGSHVIPNDKLCELGYNTLIAIQSSAFLMTLYRKNLIVQRSHAMWYTSALLVSIFHIFRNVGSADFVLKIIIVYFLRTNLNINKYVLWGGFGLVSSPWFIARYHHEVANFPLLKEFVVPASLQSALLPYQGYVIPTLNALLLFIMIGRVVTQCQSVSMAQQQLSKEKSL